jgi:flagellar biosynthesis chaperone FliJ
MLVREADYDLDQDKAEPKGADAIITDLREVQGEYAQLSELQDLERNHADKLIQSLKEIQSIVDDPIPIEKSALSAGHRHAKEAYLASDAVVVLFGNSGISSATPLSRFKPSEVLSVVQSATPHLKRMIAQKRRETSERVELLEKILKEMKKAAGSLKHDMPQYQAPVEQDLVSSSIASE